MKNPVPALRPPHRGSLSRKKTLTGYAFILPNLTGFALMTLVPLLFSFVLGFCEWDSANPIEWRGLQNYIDLFGDKYFRASILNTIYYTVAIVPTTMILSLVLAIALNSKIRFRNLFRTVYFFPYVVSTMIVCIVWNILFFPGMGPVNSLLSALGVENLPRWSADAKWAMPTVIGVGIWQSMGYYMIVYLAALQGIPPELYEAAALDGAGSWAKFRYITWPSLRATNFFVMIMLTIGGFNVFDQVFMLTEGGPGRSSYVIVYYMYEKAFRSYKFGYASAMGTILFLIIFIIILIQFRVNKKQET